MLKDWICIGTFGTIISLPEGKIATVTFNDIWNGFIVIIIINSNNRCLLYLKIYVAPLSDETIQIRFLQYPMRFHRK